VAYIGTQPLAGQYRKLDDISSGFNGATTSFTTSVGGTNVTAGSPQQLLVSLGGVIQQPTTDYTVNTSTIIFTTAPASGLSFFAILMGDALNTSVPADGSITSAKLAGSLSVGLAAGSASTPSLFFTGDLNTGIYSPGTDQVAISTGGTGRLFVDSSGRVGLGISSPGAILDVSGSGNLVRFGDGTNTFDVRFKGPNNWAVQLDTSADKFNIQRNSSSLVTVASSGAVGIGTTSPASLLDISSSNPVFIIRNTNTSSSAVSEITNVFTDSAANGDRAGGQIRFIKEGTYTHGTGATYDSALSFNVSRDNANQEAARIDSSGRLLVGTSSARSDFFNTTTFSPRFQIEGTDFNGSMASLVCNSTTDAPYLVFGRSKGTSTGSATVVASGDIAGYISFQAADGTDMVRAATIECAIDGTPGANDMPGRLVFSTTADGASSPTGRLQIKNTGNHNIFAANDALYIETATGAGTSNFLVWGGHSASGFGSVSTNCLRIYTNGNIQNTNNSYGQISDIKLKENIVDANSQWSDLKAVRVRNFNFKEGQTHRQIGVIAQELEEVSPGLVYETSDRDEKGNETGEVTKGVNYSVLYMKAVKALQEAMERIEQLESEMAEVKAQLQAS
jgi:hypothetical protein